MVRSNFSPHNVVDDSHSFRDLANIITFLDPSGKVWLER